MLTLRQCHSWLAPFHLGGCHLFTSDLRHQYCSDVFFLAFSVYVFRSSWVRGAQWTSRIKSRYSGSTGRITDLLLASGGGGFFVVLPARASKPAMKNVPAW